MKVKLLLVFVTLLFISVNNLQAQESTNTLLEKAQIQAKKEDKKIFVKFEASWCGWCHRMTKNMKAESTKKFFNDNYILVPIVVFESDNKKNLENPEGEDLIKKFNNGNSRVGLPFWFVLDTDLNLVADSYNTEKQNLGCPASKEEVEEFIKKIKITATTAVTDADIASIRKQFILKD
ncbi:MAG: thiol-disulfide isomerase/thioredoxin [Polaribacter sp.]|jgi:thiol-disulfide isomerase/thioredoxin